MNQNGFLKPKMKTGFDSIRSVSVRLTLWILVLTTSAVKTLLLSFKVIQMEGRLADYHGRRIILYHQYAAGLIIHLCWIKLELLLAHYSLSTSTDLAAAVIHCFQKIRSKGDYKHYKDYHWNKTKTLKLFTSYHEIYFILVCFPCSCA